MRARTILILAVAALVLAGAAAIAVHQRESRTAAAARSDEPLAPELAGRANDVARITVASAEGSFTLERAGEGWGAADKGGYPVDRDKVRQLVLALHEARIVEEKTKNPEHYARLGIQDPGEEGAESQRVTLATADGEVLADVVVGDAAPMRARGIVSQPTFYARRHGWERSFEVTGRVTVDSQISPWLDKEAVKLERKRVRRVEITHPDGERLVVSRETPEETDFAVQDLPEGAELSWPGIAGSLASSLEYLNIEDVVPASEVDFETGEPTVARFTTFDGLVVTARTLEQDERAYLSIDAEFDPSLRPEARIGPPEPAAEEPEAPAEGEPEEALEEPEEPAGKTAEEVREEAQKIDERVSRWVYVIPGYGAANLRKRTEDLLKQKTPADQGVEPTEAGPDLLSPEELPDEPPDEPPPDEPPPDEPPPDETPPDETPPVDETPPDEEIASDEGRSAGVSFHR